MFFILTETEIFTYYYTLKNRTNFQRLHILCETLRKIFTYFSYDHKMMPIFHIIFNQVCRFTELPKESSQTVFKYLPNGPHIFQSHFTSFSHKLLPVVYKSLHEFKQNSG